ALLLCGMTDRPGHAPRRDAVEQPLPLGFGEHLGVAHLVDALVTGQHRRAHADGPGPRSPAHLVDADHDLGAGLPEVALQTQAGDDVPDHQRSSTPGSPACTAPTTV